MKSAVLLIVHSLVLIVKALRPGGVKAIIAENALLWHQLAVLGRSRQKAPSLRTSDRFLLAAVSLLVSPRRLSTVAIIIKPATLLKFHRALVKRKYRRLFSTGASSASVSITTTWMASPYAECSTTLFQGLIHPATLAATTTHYSCFIAGRRT